MHEMALCESIVQTLEREAARQNFSRVRTVRLEIGPLAGVEIEALRFGFDATARGTIAEAATLEIDETPGEAWCRPCARAVPIARRYDPCPRCGARQMRITRGEELRIKELEVE